MFNNVPAKDINHKMVGYLVTDLAESEFSFCAPGIIGGSML